MGAGKNFIIWYGHQPQLVVTEPEQIKEILNNKDGSYPKTKLEGYIKKLLGDGILMSEGEKWFQQRKLANHALHGESLKVNSSFGCYCYICRLQYIYIDRIPSLIRSFCI